MPRRAADIRALGRDALLTVECSEAAAVLRFRPGRRDPRSRREDRRRRVGVLRIHGLRSVRHGRRDRADARRRRTEAEPAMHLLAGLFADQRDETWSACGTKRNGRSAFPEAAGRLGPRLPRQVRDAPRRARVDRRPGLLRFRREAPSVPRRGRGGGSEVTGDVPPGRRRDNRGVDGPSRHAAGRSRRRGRDDHADARRRHGRGLAAPAGARASRGSAV